MALRDPISYFADQVSKTLAKAMEELSEEGWRDLIIRGEGDTISVDSGDITADIPLEVPPVGYGDFAFPCYQLTRFYEAPPNNVAFSLFPMIQVTKDLEPPQLAGPYINFAIRPERLVEETLRAALELGERALQRIGETASSSFACDLRKWLEIMQAYEAGGHAYHATMPTDALRIFRDTMKETEAYGFERVRGEQIELGRRVRDLLESRGFSSVAAEGFQAPGVVVSYTEDPDLQNGSKFIARGLQIAAGVPLMCDEGDDYRSFRIGLFGLDKLHHIDRTVGFLAKALDQMN